MWWSHAGWILTGAAMHHDTAILKRYVYAYDLAGNRTSEQIDDAVTGATYNTMNQLVSQQAAGGMLAALAFPISPQPPRLRG